ncbi:serine/threonine-protein kinase [Streptomyces sp. NPDC016640]|uniref:serine/threonine-protein kinase n=1 Tax=Streptomyces sp. NPDC016640 TaxID=3364969 RepID=UPI0036F6DEB9
MSYDGGPRGVQGRLVGGRYRLTERVGSGGTGTVWRALDEFVQREVALREPRLPGEPGDESRRRAVRRLHREARAAARVEHPSALSILDVVVEEDDGAVRADGVEAVDGTSGLPWIVMEFVRGESLREVLERGPLPPAEAARIGLAVLGALRAAHSVGIVHREVKPANVLLGPHRRVVLTDFGIAHGPGDESVASGGEFGDPPEYVAPERRSGRTAGPASDLWSLGVLLYTAVEGRPPFRRTVPEPAPAAIVTSEDPPEPKQAGALGPLLSRLLTEDPAERPGAEEVAGALEAASHEAVAVRESTPDDTPTLRPDPPEPSPAGPDPAEEPAGPDPAEEPGRTRMPEPEPEPVPPAPLPHRLRRRAPLAALGALLVAGGAWSATSAAGRDATAAAEEPTAPTTAAWTAHRESAMDAVLFLPPGYQEAAREGGAEDGTRLVVYASDGGIRVRLTRWDTAPGSPMARAKEDHAARDGRAGDARTRYTRTGFQGHEAVLADTAWGPDGSADGTPGRALRLVIRTDEGAMYELRVDMPRGAPPEKQGEAVFRGARDRLEIGPW